jgi:catechol 2,3-dioxygenase-like lactoylglutathione lyase family enzyme
MSDGARHQSSSMTTPYAPATEQLVVEVYVRDLDRALAFYRRLGFEMLSRHGGFAAVTWERHRLFLDERPACEPPASPQANVRVIVPDVDAWWRRVTDMGARVLAPVADRDYGLRDFTVADPDGFGIRFATRIEGSQER